MLPAAQKARRHYLSMSLFSTRSASTHTLESYIIQEMAAKIPPKNGSQGFKVRAHLLALGTPFDSRLYPAVARVIYAYLRTPNHYHQG